MRVVYDTSVLVTILSRRDLILNLQKDLSRGAVVLISSQFILNELERVLSGKFGLTKQSAKTRVRLLGRIAEVVKLKGIQRIVRDVNDDPIIATAVAGGAKYIVTIDKDLLVLEKHDDIMIIEPEKLKKELAKQSTRLTQNHYHHPNSNWL